MGFKDLFVYSQRFSKIFIIPGDILTYSDQVIEGAILECLGAQSRPTGR